MTLFDRALAFAAEKHEGMLRKYAKTPYVLHPMEAAVIVGTMTDDEEVLAAALLHDTVEDTDTTLEELAERFGPRVAELVASETEEVWPELTAEQSWTLRKEHSLQKLAETCDPAVRMIWMGDKLSNMRSFYRVWKVSGDEVWAHLSQKDPARQAWYYRRIEELLSDLKEHDAWQEFHRLVETVFASEGAAE